MSDDLERQIEAATRRVEEIEERRSRRRGKKLSSDVESAMSSSLDIRGHEPQPLNHATSSVTSSSYPDASSSPAYSSSSNATPGARPTSQSSSRPRSSGSTTTPSNTITSSRTLEQAPVSILKRSNSLPTIPTDASTQQNSQEIQDTQPAAITWQGIKTKAEALLHVTSQYARETRDNSHAVAIRLGEWIQGILTKAVKIAQHVTFTILLALRISIVVIFSPISYLLRYTPLGFVVRTITQFFCALGIVALVLFFLFYWLVSVFKGLQAKSAGMGSWLFHFDVDAVRDTRICQLPYIQYVDYQHLCTNTNSQTTQRPTTATLTSDDIMKPITSLLATPAWSEIISNASVLRSQGVDIRSLKKDHLKLRNRLQYSLAHSRPEGSSRVIAELDKSVQVLEDESNAMYEFYYSLVRTFSFIVAAVDYTRIQLGNYAKYHPRDTSMEVLRKEYLGYCQIMKENLLQVQKHADTLLDLLSNGIIQADNVYNAVFLMFSNVRNLKSINSALYSSESLSLSAKHPFYKGIFFIPAPTPTVTPLGFEGYAEWTEAGLYQETRLITENAITLLMDVKAFVVEMRIAWEAFEVQLADSELVGKGTLAVEVHVEALRGLVSDLDILREGLGERGHGRLGSSSTLESSTSTSTSRKS